MNIKTVPSYLKNVGRSLGYTVADVAKEYNPTLSKLIKDTKDTTVDLYQSIKYSSSSSNDEKLLSGKIIKDTVKDAWSNTKEDLKSGNWYNKSRGDQASEQMMKSMGFDMDFNFDFDEDWGDFDEKSDLDADTEVIVNNQNASTAQIINSVDVVGSKISASITGATVESASYIVESARQSNKALYGLNQRGFNQVTTALMTLNNSVVSIAKLGEPLTAHMQNSSVFYTKTTETLNKMEQSLQQIVKNTTPAPLATNSKYKSATGTLGSILDDGVISIDSFKNMIKDNFGEYKDILSMGLDMIKGMKAEGGSYGKYISPMAMISKMVTGMMIPKAIKDSMKSMNDSIKYSISGSLVKARGSSTGNFLLDMLKDMFLPQDRFKNTINTANYEKGQVAWDGISRKALTEVIPVALMKIYSAISGGPEMRYDYNAGKFVTISSIKAKKEEDLEKAAKSAGGDFRDDALKIIDEMKDATKVEQEKLKAEIEMYFKTAFKEGSGFENTRKSNFNKEKFGLTDESLKILNNLISEYESGEDKSKRSRHTKFFTDVALGRDAYGDSKRREESTGISNEIYLNNWDNTLGKKGAPVFDDETGHSINFYLKGIYQYTGYLADNIDYIGGRSSKVRKRKNVTRGGKVQDILNPQPEKSSGEKTIQESNEDVLKDEDTLRQEKIDENKEKLDEGIKNAKSKVREKINKIFCIKDGESFGPINAITRFLDKATVSMNKLIWGDDDNPENGIMGLIFSKTKDALGSFKDYIEDTFKVNLKDKYNQAVDWLFGEKDEEGKRSGGKLGDLRDDTVNTFKNIGGSLGKTAKQIFKGKDIPVNNGSAAYGRKVTRSGIVAVSEGELIVPSELNPFYHGITNKRAQIQNERNILNNFYGSFAEGGTVGGTIHQNGVFDYLKQGAGNLGSGIYNTIKQALGLDEETIKKDKEKVADQTKSILGELGKSKGAVTAGAIVGTGAGLLTGTVVGPLFGAAIGGAVGLIADNENIKTLLFGEPDENGERGGGKLSKGMTDFITKNVPNMGKGAALGGLAGLFMGSPILGAVLGSAVAYASTSEKAKEYIFGKVDEYGFEVSKGLIPRDLQDKIKKASPSISIGALAGAALGPFGLVGNLALGAGLGYLTTSDKFHEYMFGNGEDDKGLVGIVKDKILKNIDDFGHNMFNAVKGFTRNLFDSAKEKIHDLLTKTARAYQNGEQQGLLGRVVGGTMTAAGGLVKGVTNKVGDVLGGMADSRRRKNLQKGYQVYDVDLKRNLTAAERVQARGEGNKYYTFGQLDKVIADAKSKDELDALKNQLADLKDPKRMFKRAKNDALNELYSALRNLDPKVATKIANFVVKDKREEALKLLRSQKVDAVVMQRCEDAIIKAADAIKAASDENANRNKALEVLKKQGINLKKPGDINNALDLIESEKNSRFSEEQEAENKEEEYKSKVQTLLESIDTNIAILTKASGAEPEVDDESSKAVINKSAEADKEGGLPNASPNIDTDNDEDTATTTGTFGVTKLVKNSQGEMVPDTRDSETRETEEFRKTFKESISHIPLLGTAIGGLSGLFGSFKDKLLGGEGEKKEGLLSKLLGFFSGDNEGPLSWITNLLTGSNNVAGSVTKSAISGKSLFSVIKNFVGPALLAVGLFGGLDKLGEELSNNVDGLKGNDTKATLADNSNYYVNGKEVATDENGNVVTNENGEYQLTDGTYEKGSLKAAGTDTSISRDIKRNLLSKTILGQKSLVTEGAKKFVTGVKGAKNAFSKKSANAAAETVKDVATNKSMMTGVMKTISNLLEKIPEIIGKIPFLPNKVKDGAELIATAIYTHLDDAVKKAGSKLVAIAGKLSNLVVALKVAYVVGVGINAWGNAESILGITEEATFGQKIIATLIAIVNSLIPFVGDLIPNNVLVNIFMEVAPKLGIDVSDLAEQRERAKREVEEHNKKNNTNLSVEEFNQLNGKAGIFTKAGNAVKSWFTKSKSSKGKKNIEAASSRRDADKYVYSGSGSGFVSQLDNKYKDMKFGNSTVGRKGCAPAVATMVANAYGNNLSMANAVSGASRYMNDEGTTTDYFKDILGRNGISTEYISGQSKDVANKVIRSLSNGEKVILLGKDPNNTSKVNSPFGPNGHYVLATGIDKNGKIIISDPEAKGPMRYDPSILKSAKMGIGTSAGGSTYENDYTAKVWSFLTSNGYSPAAAAGIMGNMWQESKVNPTAIQGNGKGPAAGIVQWENYAKQTSRWKAMYDYATSKGYKWTELTPQLEYMEHEMNNGMDYWFNRNTTVPSTAAFKAMTDPMDATLAFEKAFERAGKPNMEARYKAAEAFYKLYQDSSYTGKWVPEAPDPNATDTLSSGLATTTEGDKSSNKLLGIISTITTAFSNAFTKAFKGSDDSSSTSTSSGYSNYGLTENVVPAIGGPGNSKQKELAQKLLEKQGQLSYSMTGARNPDKGSADCSSTINWAYKNVLNTDIGNSTPAILSNNNTEIIDIAKGANRDYGITNSSGPNVGKLMPGDILLYSRPNKDYSAGRPYRVGHVEMYIGDNKRIGHGGGQGPKVSDITQDSSRYIMAKRFKNIKAYDDELSAAGSGLIGYNDIANLAGGSSGILLNARPGSRVYGKAEPTVYIKKPVTLAGGEYRLVEKSTRILNNIKSNIETGSKSGSISPDVVERLIRSITNVLELIASNTAPVEKIYKLLSEYINSKSDPKKQNTTNTPTTAIINNKNDFEKEIDVAIVNLVGTLGEIARG